MNRTVLSIFGLEPSKLGGAERFAAELSRQLGSLGWKSVLCFLTPPTESVRRCLDMPNVSIEAIGSASKVRWRRMRDLGRLLGRYRPQILHLHFTRYTRAYPWLARLYSVPGVFYTHHGSRPEGYVIQRASLWKRAMTHALHWPLSSEICVSDYTRRCVVGLGLVPAGRVKLIYNSVDLGDFTTSDGGANFRRRHSIPPDRALVVQVSWIIPEKGLEDLLTAAKLVVEQNPRVHFAVVGEGAYREQYMRQSVEMGLAHHVTWTGQLEDPVAEGAYAAADLLCVASRWEEAFGWVIAEGMASAKPVVATRVGGIPEVVVDGETGFLVPRRDCHALAEKILQMIADPALRERMGRAGRKVAEAKFDQKRNVAELIRLYGIAPSNQENRGREKAG